MRYIGPSPPLSNYDRQGTASGTCFCSGKFLSLTAFGGVCRTETTQRQKRNKTENLRSDAYYLGVVAQGDSGLAVAPLGIDSTGQLVILALASTANRSDDVRLRRGAEDIRRTFRPVTVRHHYCISLPPILSPESALSTGPKADARLERGRASSIVSGRDGFELLKANAPLLLLNPASKLEA